MPTTPTRNRGGAPSTAAETSVTASGAGSLTVSPFGVAPVPERVPDGPGKPSEHPAGGCATGAARSARPAPRQDRGVVVRGWAQAWEDALYGPRGFYVAGPGSVAGPGGHFRTSVHVGPVFHGALARLLAEVDGRLGAPPVLDLVDVGSGRGELLTGVLAALPGEVAARVRPVAVEVRSRPAELGERIGWLEGTAPQVLSDHYPGGVRGLVLAHEWLDDVPCDVVEVDSRGVVRLVLVDDDGSELSGPDLADAAGCRTYGVDAGAALAWLQRWWPVSLPGARAEVGSARDLAWSGLTAALASGTALAVDYGHRREQRLAGRYDAGTLTAYRAGRVAAPVPDGSVDLTAHVAIDACAAATVGAGAYRGTVRVTGQRAALGALGVSGALPPRELASDPARYAAALDVASQAAELRDPLGLGAFCWLRLDR